MSLFIVLFSLVLFPNLSSLGLGIRLPLRHPQSSDNPLYDLYRSSLLRAHHIKNPHSKHSSPIAVSLSPHSYGGYTLPVAFGTPPQPFPLLLDTGSQLTWIPCTTSYLCRSCPSRIPAFLPKLSNSSRLVGCRNPKCSWIHPAPTRNCSQARQQPEACSPYFITYGSGSTAGLLLSETLRLSDQAFPDFGVGCSLVSDHQPAAGIAGFGRGSVSIPAQLNLTRFSYCLISRRFDENPDVTGTLILNEENPNPNPKNSLSYTPFLKNPSIVNGVFSVYYYVGLRKITVGGKKVKIPHRALVAGPDGGGGVIVDSGTTFTYVHPSAFDPLLAAFVESVGGEFNRSSAAEEGTGLRPCFDLGEERGAVRLPELALHFKGGAAMRLPVENYFAFVGRGSSVICLTVASDGGDGSLGNGGPSIILGSFQQQNYYVEYDLERGRFGFRQQSCVVSDK